MSKPLHRRIMLVLLLLIAWVSSSAAQQGFTPPAEFRQGLGTPGAAQQGLPRGVTPLTPGTVLPGDNVSIEGEVLRPGWYPLPLRAETRLKNLIIQAGGLTKALDEVRGQVIRVSEAGDLRVFFFSPAEVLKGLRRENIILQAHDRVVIFTVTDRTKKETDRLAEQVGELSTIERLIAGRIPEVEVPLRQFGYDLFAPVRPETVPPPEQRTATPGDQQTGRRALPAQGGTETFVDPFTARETSPLPGQAPFGGAVTDPRFAAPAVDLRFAPPTRDVPVGPDYVIGAGDSLNIVLWGGVEASYQVEVTRNGTIVLPRLGALQVGGMTFEQLERFLRQRFKTFYPDFQMAVSLGQLRTIRVFVVGEVQQPGSYTVSALSTIINALFVSGGPTKNGSLRDIRLSRQGQVVHHLDLYDFLLRGDKSQDRTIQSGDTIFVPVIGAVAGVAGNVRRPAIYEIKPGVTLQQLLADAGGVTPQGYLQQVHVERFIDNRRKVVVDFDLSMSQTAAGSAWKTPIQDGDLVRIFPIVTTLDNIVRLDGHVKRPGRYELKPGMRLRDLLPSYDVLLPDVYLDYAEVVRQVLPDLHRRVLPFNLGQMLRGHASQNLALHPRDIVRIFSRDDFVDPRLVRISGLVHRPGVYTLTDDMRVRDLVLRAGNLHKFAYLGSTELTRQSLTAGEDRGERVEIDLSKALAGDPAHNLLLRDFDHLLVRQMPGVDLKDEETGADRERPMDRRQQLLIADRRQQLLITAEGESRSVEPDTAVLYPLQEDDEQALAAMRRANILQERFVELSGEVRFPGAYPIQKGERLSSVIERAGGFTDAAYLRGAVFTRVSVQQAQQKRMNELLQEEEQALLAETATVAGTALSAEEVQARQQETAARRDLLNRLRTVQLEGRIVIRLQPFATFAGSEQDIELESGDRLRVPQTPEYVSLLGEVYNRTSVIHEARKDIGYYLEKVGGITPRADEKAIYLVQVDGTVLSNTQDQLIMTQADGKTTYLGDFFDVQPQPGDTIVVPRKVKTQATLRLTRDIMQIVFQSVSSLAIVLALL